VPGNETDLHPLTNRTTRSEKWYEVGTSIVISFFHCGLQMQSTERWLKPDLLALCVSVMKFPSVGSFASEIHELGP